MKIEVVLLAMTMAGVLGAQQLDLSSLDRLGARAKSVNKVSLTKPQLADALSLLSNSDANKKELEDLKRLVANLTGVDVRTFEFKNKGQFHDSDLKEIRDQLAKLKDWSKVIDSKEDGEHSEIYMSSAEGHKGLVIISSEDAELSVVVLKGLNSLRDLGGLGGVLGIPNVVAHPASKED